MGRRGPAGEKSLDISSVFIPAADKCRPAGIPSPRNASANLSIVLQIQQRLFCPFGEGFQAPNIRFRTSDPDQSYRSSIRSFPPDVLLNPFTFPPNIPDTIHAAILLAVAGKHNLTGDYPKKPSNSLNYHK
jgi:hypothetical protein